ncbi:hypothetical protein [Gymnodinialimonas ceratoperidinii]|uniref:Uncharacterized protein n=1 Tax=Gymnodinialimonas ceratoperidinii TaxID=2856823 RepID=A0A8F6YA21_9RHOB|nr:hypothetical protein [Gymnodinialimonas ceratoperidinii]QXT39519.1 hypothetical protein KYE46_16595 [Gymnodinialimonas ceratoperidinii]
MSPFTLLRASAAVALSLTTPAAGETLLVTNFYPTGPGSLQEALDAAAASEERTVILMTEADGTISTEVGLRYEGSSPLVIHGNGVTIASPNDVTLLTAIGPRLLAITGARFSGPGGYSLANQSTGAAGKGIFLGAADAAGGEVSLVLSNVTVAGVAGHGIHVSDCARVDACGSGDGAAGDGSPASLRLELNRVYISDVGQGRHDADGLRVDERGPGDILLTAVNFTATGVGADGIELDEGQSGSVIADLVRADFIENGSYCDPAVLETFLPRPPEATFREFELIAADLPQPDATAPDLSCIEADVETFDGGSVAAYAYGIDVDDGFDIGEAGPGSVIATLSIGQILGNFDEGYDFDEEGPGDIDVVFTGIIGNGNLDDAIKLSEEDAGHLYVTATAVELSSNGGLGLDVEEEGAGDLTLTLVGSASAGNDGGEMGVEAAQSGSGAGNIYVVDTEIADGIETDGATLDAD